MTPPGTVSLVLGAGAVLSVAWITTTDNFYTIGALTLLLFLLVPSALALALGAWVTSKRDGKTDAAAVGGGLLSLAAVGLLLSLLFLLEP
jgi:hypothetical protein